MSGGVENTGRRQRRHLTEKAHAATSMPDGEHRLPMFQQWQSSTAGPAWHTEKHGLWPTLLIPSDQGPCFRPCQLTWGGGLTQGHHICLSRAVTGWAQALMTNASRSLIWNTQTIRSLPPPSEDKVPRLLRLQHQLEMRYWGHIYTTNYSLVKFKIS